MRSSPAPSIRADSTYSDGIFRMNWRMRNTPKASTMSGPARPWYVFSQPNLWTIRKVGTSVTSSGSMSVLRITSSTHRSPGKRNLARPWPASVQNRRLPAVTTAETTKLFQK